MNYNILYTSIVCLLLGTSCSSLRTITAKDSASANTRMPKKASTAAKRGFIEQIELAPGASVQPSQAVSLKVSQPGKKTSFDKKPVISYTKPDLSMASSNIENANMLQLKYAILMDATVEKLTNIPLLETIDKWWGTKYCMGGSTENCIDCSAFTQLVLQNVYQQSLPRTSQEQYNACVKVELEDMKEGDLVFFNTTGSDISHVGVYLLNNKFVHASTSGGVMISDLNESYWQHRFKGAGRMEQ